MYTQAEIKKTEIERKREREREWERDRGKERNMICRERE